MKTGQASFDQSSRIKSAVIAQILYRYNERNTKPTGRYAAGNRRKDQRINKEQANHCFDDCNYALIDYRNSNKVIMKRVMPRVEAKRKNKFLKGSGKAWARIAY